MDNINYSALTPQLIDLAKMSEEAGVIETELFDRYEVKRGLRDLNGKGVLAGLTNISDVRAKKVIDGVEVKMAKPLDYYDGVPNIQADILCDVLGMEIEVGDVFIKLSHKK